MTVIYSRPFQYKNIYCKEPIPTCEILHIFIVIILADNPIELAPIQNIVTWIKEPILKYRNQLKST